MSDTFVESDNSFCDKEIIQQRKKRRRMACKKYNRKRSKKLSLRKNEARIAPNMMNIYVKLLLKKVVNLKQFKISL
jgi:hypothetical protein